MSASKLSIKSTVLSVFGKGNTVKKNLPPERYEILAAKALLYNSEVNAKLVNSIKELVALPDELFDAYYLPPLIKYAEFVQSLPASRGHHHANAGGLLTHTLEVVYYGLRRKGSYVLPPGTAPENVSESEQRWIYGVFITCLLHDLGKPITDMLCTVFDDGNNVLGRWSPLMGPMSVLESAYSYSIKFAPRSNYEYHGEMTLLLYALIVPPRVSDWLQRDLVLFQTILRALNGQQVTNNILKDIIKFADSESTKRNIGATGAVNIDRVDKSFSGLHDKILGTIKYLITETSNLTFNRPGAIGYVFEDHIYFVSKKIVDLLRDTMTRRGIKGVPSDNGRMFDIMQEHNIIVKSSRDKAIWNTVVNLEDPEWNQALSMIKVPISVLGLINEERPESIKGLLSFDSRDCEQAETTTVSQTPKISDKDVNKADSVQTETNEKPSQPEAHAPTAPPKEDNAKVEKTKSKSTFVKEVCVQESKPDTKTVSPVVKEQHTQHTKSLKAQRGEYFVSLIRRMISEKALAYNTTRSMIHVISDDKKVLLVSPKLFRHVLTLQSEKQKLIELDIFSEDDKEITNSKITKLQKGFFELKHHALNPATHKMITPVLVQGGPGGKVAQLNGVVVEDWSLFFSSEPPKNANISFIDE